MSERAVRLPISMRVFERGWLSSNNVLFTGRSGSALVDSGYATHANQTVALVERALGQRPLDLLINTHLHSDHCGGNALLQQRYGCRTLIPAAEAVNVCKWDQHGLSFAATGQQCVRFGFDAVLTPGDTIVLGDLDWQFLGAPGHDPHSLIMYCPAEQILISADALWQYGFGVIFPELQGESGFAETRATLELIARLDIRLVIPGHGAPFVDVQDALARAFSRLDYLAAEPVRNARNAVKVLLKFLLLERQHIACDQVAPLLAAMPLFRQSQQRYLPQSDDAIAEWAIAQLVKTGVARIAGKRLLNHDQPVR